jgi:glycerol-3-phosphate dehydrogenase
MNPWVRATLQDLAGSTVDLLVIGGGITGAGIAREAALAGLAVALVDARDFGAGTSSRSSRLIHGGLRYLEHGHLRLVFEAVRERSTLLRLAPHLVRPLPFVLPAYQGDRVPRWKLAAGLTLYDLLAAGGNVPRHRTLGKRALLQREPLLRERGLAGGAMYWDAQCDDARLTLATVRAAAERGALASNYMQVIRLVNTAGRITGARLQDALSGDEGEIRARVIVNAAGPWADGVRRLEDPYAGPILRLTRGTHVLVPRSRVGNRHAVIFTSPVDGRVMFILPWTEAWTYIGTTDTDDVAGPDDLAPRETDLVYLLRSANALFPAARLEPDDIVSSWAGLRPLLAEDPATPASAVSREHRILRGAAGLITIAGGKLTTYRRMATQVLRWVFESLGRGRYRPGAASEREPLPGGAASMLESFRAPGEEIGLAPSTVEHLLRTYGAETPAIYALCRDRRELMTPLHPEHPAIAAEVVQAARREFAVTVDDVLLRRTHLAQETHDGGGAARARVAELLMREQPMARAQAALATDDPP